MNQWILTDVWELGYEYECPHCHKYINVQHKGVVLPVKCLYYNKKVGDKDG